jgi:tetratricopeptide (TPR) repeat protein
MIGRTISHYRIIRKLGEGGMGIVYEAEDTKLGRMVALKFLPPEWMRDADARARFLHEARSAASLNHPNICTIHEIDEAEDQTFIAMALVDGESLRDRIERRPLRMSDALDIAIQIAEGLAAAHAKGVVHRDVKPGNVMVTPEGHARIMDFGLAKSRGQTRLTRTGSTTGTTAYMSPEQARGENVDQRADMWSFGAMLYEMVTGQRPFRGEHEQAVIHAILNAEPEPMTALRTGVPMELERITRKAMAKRPDERYQHMDDLVADLKALKRSSESATMTGPAAATPRAQGHPGSRPNGLRRAVVALLLVIAAASVVVVTVRLKRDAAATRADRVVVAPFENRTGDAALDAIGSMAADWITTGLAQMGTIDVVPTTAVTQFEASRPEPDRKARVAPAALAAATGAGIVVSGSYYLVADSLRFQVEVTDAAHGTMLHALPETGGPRSAPKIAIEAMAQRVMGALAAQLGSVSLGAWVMGASPPRYDAYREFSTGMTLFGPDYPGAIEHFRRSAALDTSFIAPQIYTVFCYMNMGQTAKADSLHRVVRRRRSRLTTYEALFMDYGDASLRGNHDEALRVLRRLEAVAPSDLIIKFCAAKEALFLNRPKEALAAISALASHAEITRVYAGAWTYGTWADVLDVLGKYDEELRVVREARQAYPDVLWLRGREARALVGLGRLKDVTALVDETLAAPQFGTSTPAGVMDVAARALRAHGFRKESIEVANRAVEWRTAHLEGRLVADDPIGYTALASALYSAERWEESRRLCTELAALAPADLDVKGYMGVLAARRGDKDEARRIIEELRQSRAPYRYGMDIYWSACIAAQLGERDSAVRFLREAFSQGASMAPQPMEDMDLEPLHGYKPFEELMKPKG